MDLTTLSSRRLIQQPPGILNALRPFELRLPAHVICPLGPAAITNLPDSTTTISLLVGASLPLDMQYQGTDNIFLLELAHSLAPRINSSSGLATTKYQPSFLLQHKKALPSCPEYSTKSLSSNIQFLLLECSPIIIQPRAGEGNTAILPEAGSFTPVVASSTVHTAFAQHLWFAC
jgi:hypothetical protein